jgi:hypothetical protein
MTIDWREWHRAYDVPASPLAQRLVIVQQCIRDALDEARPGRMQVISMCAGEGRDLIGALDGHPRRDDVAGRLVELDPELAARAREAAPPRIDVLVADAGISDAYEDAVPADLVLVCGVFGNVSDGDIERTLRALPMLCAPRATVIWTRHRRPPDATPRIRGLLAEAGFEEQAFVAPAELIFGVGRHVFRGTPDAFRPHVRLFDFVGFNACGDACRTCGFSYALHRGEILPWLRVDADGFVARLRSFDEASVRRRPAPDVWSPLEYACHVRDVLRVQRARIEQAQREEVPEFAPMRREERVVEDRYNEQDPAVVADEIVSAARDLEATLAALDDDGWTRTGIYNYPARAERTVEWIAAHTVHELLHHRIDIGTLA